ncbi:thioredoxin-dependent thiol peroxidase [Sphingomonas lacunae]|uniref:thioredoxin-dependent peroxiredoxin n=1 Tax=Sphingomonas lacunae TaxID=2698828 RepID=A0A6M4AQA5_9SPHN|nr:thioredoxin-dependent thiol peroxidase [Sphingomonas lacunae]QJQ31203.1 thioredoxin-dependent thiol peroxidase [Sphingomonas lacunae]
MLNEGDRMPAATLMMSDGSTVNLAGLEGRALVLYFYPKADTPGCTNEAKDFSALASDFDAIGVRVIGVSKDSPKKLAKFADKYSLNLLLGSDEHGHVTEDFGAWVEKSMYGKTYMGIERCTFLFNGDGTLVRQWRKVKVKGHADEVLAAARAI